MFESSTQAIEDFIARIDQQMNENQHFVEKKQPTVKETIARNQKLIDDSKTPPIERLRALIINVLESDEIMRLHRERASLLQSSLFANYVRIFQEEVGYELNMLNAKFLFHRAGETLKSEEPEKYAQIEEQLQKIKHTMDEEWKPLMDKIKEKIDARDKFLNKHT